MRNMSSNIIDAISKVPGVNALTTGPNVSKPFIRGLGFNRILTLYDGVRQEGQQWGDEHGIEVDQYGIERIEVIKGTSQSKLWIGCAGRRGKPYSLSTCTRWKNHRQYYGRIPNQ